MPVKIIKQGIADSIQDLGRYGYQHMGINPGGVMDTIAASVANMLVGNDINAPVIECHFPAASFLFDQPALIAISGANFSPAINNKEIPVNTPLIIQKNSILSFTRGANEEARCYIAVAGGFTVPVWLNSYSTNTKAEAGGYHGRRLLKDDILPFSQDNYAAAIAASKGDCHLPWQASATHIYLPGGPIRFCEGKHYSQLNTASTETLSGSLFTITAMNDRMGYRLQGSPLQLQQSLEPISAGVTKGTMQLLPGGQLIVLMADHQTTGGYPVIGHVIEADIPRLARMKQGNAIQFQLTSLQEGEDLLYKQHQYLQQLQIACNLQLQQYLAQYGPYRP